MYVCVYLHLNLIKYLHVHVYVNLNGLQFSVFTDHWFFSLFIVFLLIIKVSFYIRESEASNHAVREAACACIAELGTKVSPDAVRPQVSKLVGALLDCFRDESWPVRDGKLV